MRQHRRLLLSISAAAVLLAPLGWMWSQSVLPATYSVMDMGYVDTGGAAASTHEQHGAGVSVAALTEPRTGPADVQVELIVRAEEIALASGRRIAGYTFNHRSPGPEIRVVEGQLVEVRLVNESVARGVTLHWHGVDVPNAEDGVAGVTQDAVLRGQSHTYRFVAEHAGTFWYHSHQVSHEQVQRGLLGALVVLPRPAAAAATGDAAPDFTAVSHVYAGRATVNGQEGEVEVPARPGTATRVRVINTDNGAIAVSVSGAPYRLLAVDGYELHQPTPVRGKHVLVTAGGRADLELVAPADGSRVAVELGGTTRVLIGSRGPGPPRTAADDELDLLTYGSPAPVPFDAASADRTFRYDIGRRPGFVHGRPGVWWSINGHLFPDVPMYVVREGDIVRMRISNHSGATHPMHLHGHHALVLSRNGVRASGSPWWVDSLEVASGDRYEIAFRADNPGIWMDHCHNLPHADQGLVAHLMYEGVTEPYRVGRGTPNQPE